MLLNQIFSYRTFLGTSLIVVLAGILLRLFSESVYQILFPLSKGKASSTDRSLFSNEYLNQYNGIDRSELYLAILGLVFDVTKGAKHYGKHGQYNFFVGKDGSRSFITGNFADESTNRDHVIDLTCDELFVVINWQDTYRKRYTYKGKLIGRYYDENGKATEYTKQLKAKIKQCKEDKKLSEKENQQYPPCNVEWSVDAGTRVWCSQNSGGVARSWVGVPRQLYTPGSEAPKCVCIHLGRDNSDALLKTYNECPDTAISCNISSN